MRILVSDINVALYSQNSQRRSRMNICRNLSVADSIRLTEVKTSFPGFDFQLRKFPISLLRTELLIHVEKAVVGEHARLSETVPA